MLILILKMNTTKPKQDIHGILLLNKPLALSSNQALQRCKRLYAAKKAGHTGSLDPLATGMLPICFGEATKFSKYWLDADKIYDTTGQLGVKTTTGDSEGEVISVLENVSIAQDQLEQTLQSFVGRIEQQPSMYSALKYMGKPLYHYARNGIEVPRKTRTIDIYSITLLSFNHHEFSLRVHCSKGTYIRTLIEDIGNKLEVGAHVKHLHRVATSGLENERMYTLEELEGCEGEALQQLLLPVDRAICQYPPVVLSPEQATIIRYGQSISGTFPAQGLVRLYNDAQELMGMGYIESGVLKVERLLCTSP